LIAIFLTFVSFSAIAQSETDSLASYFDDGGRGNYKFSLKVSTIEILNGEQALHLEVRPFRRVSFELSAGRLTSDYLYELEFDKVADEELGDNVNSGRMIGGRIKWYAAQKDLIGLYYGIGFYNKTYKTKSFSTDLIYSELGLDYGVIARVTPNILVDFSIGIWMRARKTEDSSIDYFENNSTLVPISLKVGYTF
jgi:hypothetical protein